MQDEQQFTLAHGLYELNTKYVIDLKTASMVRLNGAERDEYDHSKFCRVIEARSFPALDKDGLRKLTRMRMPMVFGSFQDLLYYRDRLREEFEAGRITRQQYRRRIRRACDRYNEEVDARQGRQTAEVHKQVQP